MEDYEIKLGSARNKQSNIKSLSCKSLATSLGPSRSVLHTQNPTSARADLSSG